MINGDEQLMKVLSTNLLDNACKYSDNSSVKITLSSIHERKISIDFLNTGVGIEPGEMDKIFQPFYWGKSTTKISGFGVGLSLALKITLLHNGKLTVTSIPGSETKFTLIFPVYNTV